MQSAQAQQNYTYQQSQRPNSLQIQGRGQVHGSKPSTPTSLGLPTTAINTSGYGPQTTAYQGYLLTFYHFYYMLVYHLLESQR